jgi:hypothetical protein
VIVCFPLGSFLCVGTSSALTQKVSVTYLRAMHDMVRRVMVRHVRIMHFRIIHVMVWNVREMHVWAEISGRQGIIGQGT